VYDRDPGQRALLEQTVILPGAWNVAGRTLALRAEVRSVTALSEGIEVSLRITDGFNARESVCIAVIEWRPCELFYPLGPETDQLRIVLAVGAKGHTMVEGDVYWRNVRLTSPGAMESGLQEAGANLLSNPSGEVPARRIAPLLLWGEGILRAPRGWVVALTKAESWRLDALLRYSTFSVLAFAGFWGNFGWLQAPLPWPFYLWLALLCGLAAVGLARMLASRFIERASEATDYRRAEGVVLLCTAAVALIVVQTALPMIGFAWQPQGRYLLPALLPVGACLILGLRAGLPARWQAKAEAILLGTLAISNVAMFWVLRARW
jgi:hypothetical protein